MFQQAKYIRQHTRLRVAYVYGDMNVDLWDEDKWICLFDMVDVIVMTAAILQHVLVHGFISMDRINLIVFDECHHARKNHPYNVIMREFYFPAEEESRPKIFGLTASPFCAGKSVEDSISLLETNLDCLITTVLPSYNVDLKNIVPRSEERVLMYEAYDGVCSLTELHDKYAPLVKMEDSYCRRTLLSLKYSLDELGPWCANRVIREELCLELNKMANRKLDSKLQKFNEEERSLILNIVQDLKSCAKIDLVDSNLSPKVKLLIELLYMYSSQLKEKFCCVIFVERRITAMVLHKLIAEHPKLKTLIRSAPIVGHSNTFESTMSARSQNAVLRSFKTKMINTLIATSVAEEGLDVPLCSLVVRFDLFQNLVSFVQSRGRARSLKSLFIILCKKGDEDQLNTLKKIKEAENELFMLRKLRQDHPELFFEEENESDEDGDDSELIEDAFNEKFVVTSTGATLSYNSCLPILYHFCQKLSNDIPEDSIPEFVFTKLTENNYTCDVIMPSSCSIRVIHGKEMQSKKLAKRSAAFEACKKLLESNLIDDHLLPVHLGKKALEKLTRSNDMKRLLNGIKIEDRDLPEYKDLCADFRWNTLVPYADASWFERDGDDMWLYAFEGDEGVNGLRLCSFGALVVQKFPWVPSFPLFFNYGKCERVDFKSHEVAIRLSQQELDKIKRLNSFLMRYVYLSHRSAKDKEHNKAKYIWKRVDFEEWDESYAYLFVPWNKNQNGSINIDWRMVDYIFDAESCFRNSEDEMSTCMPTIKNLQQKYPDITANDNFVVTDLMDYQKRVIVEDIREDLNPSSRVLPNDVETGSQWPPFVKKYIDGYLLWHRSIPYTRIPVNNTTIDPNQPLIKVARVPPFQSFLRPNEQISETRFKSKLTKHRIPQFSVFNPIPYSVYHAFLAFPSVCKHLENFWLAAKMIEKFELQTVPPELILEAITTGSAGLTYDYERLEILGDAFLKMAMSTELFLRYHEKQEGQLSYSRHLMVSNKALYQRASSCGIHEFIISANISPKNWRLPTSKTRLSDSVAFSGSRKSDIEMARMLAGGSRFVVVDWVVADVFEAILGACLLAGGVDLAFRALGSFGFSFEGVTEWNDYIKMVGDYYDFLAKDEEIIRMLKKEDQLKLVSIEDAEHVLGYQFQSNRVLDIAFNHDSSPYKSISSYQRLEYLGDAVLDFLVIQLLFGVNTESARRTEGYPFENCQLLNELQEYKHLLNSHQVLTPGEMTDLKSFIVSNDTLAFVSMTIQLDKFLQSFSDCLLEDINAFRNWFETKVHKDMKEEDKSALFTSAPFIPWWWNEMRPKNGLIQKESIQVLSQVEDHDIAGQMCDIPKNEWQFFIPQKFPEAPPPAPKVLSDIFESAVGAVFLDSNLNLDKVTKVLQKTLRFMQEDSHTSSGSFEEWVKNNSTEALLYRLHPVRKLQEWLDARQCHGLRVKEFPLSKRTITTSMLVDIDRDFFEEEASIDFNLILTLNDAELNINESTSTFRFATIAIYFHGVLVGIGSSRSSKVAKYIAAQQAVVTLKTMLENDVFVTKEGCLSKNVPKSFRSKCDLCGIPDEEEKEESAASSTSSKESETSDQTDTEGLSSEHEQDEKSSDDGSESHDDFE